MKKFIENLLLTAVGVICFAACTPEEEDLFDASSANRIEATLKVDKDILTGASNGWLIEYYPSPDLAYGGYTILAKFQEDGSVVIASDIANAEQKITSNYTLKQSAGPVLSFDTYNEIMHFFSDPHNPAGIGTNGKGMQGDFEFLIMDATPEKVLLKGKKNMTDLVMTPLADGVDWTSYIEQIQDADDAYSQFVAYKYVEGDFHADVKVSYRKLVITYTDAEDNLYSINAPYIITNEQELKFYEPLSINGKTIEALKYVPDEKYGTFVPTNEVAATFTPAFPLSYFLLNQDWFFAYSQLGSLGRSYWDYCITNSLIPNGITLNYALFTPYDGSSQLVFLWGHNLGDDGMLLFNATTLSDTRVKLDFALSGNSWGVTFYNQLNWIYILYPFNSKTFTLSADNDENPTVLTLTDEATPANVITLSKEMITDPLNK